MRCPICIFLAPLTLLISLNGIAGCSDEGQSESKGAGGTVNANGGAGGSGNTMMVGNEASGGVIEQPEDCTVLTPATYNKVKQCVIYANSSCSSSICHGGQQDLLLRDVDSSFSREARHSPYDSLYETLLNFTVVECGAVPLVSPGAPNESALLMVMRHECGDLVMPEGFPENPTLPQQYIDLISSWIADGALK